MRSRQNKVFQKENNEKKFKKGELKRHILKALGISLVVGGTIVFPTLPLVYGTIMTIVEVVKGGGEFIPEKKVRRALKNLEKRNIIHLEEKNGEALVYIEDKENIEILKYSLKAVLDFKEKEKKWNGKWFLVFFDIPETQKNKRAYLRRFLYQLGFYRYQKSVYLFPYECEKEIELIKRIVEGGKYIQYVVAEKISNESDAKLHFRLN
jgi:CRISPR-associated endonuclease Cas2